VQKALSQQRVAGWARGALAVGALAACLFAASCSGLSSAGESAKPTPLEVAAQLRFTDLPVPGGFKFLSSRSWDYERGTLRLCAHLYEGRARSADVAEFFRSQMPVSNWRLVSEHLDRGQRVMNFSKTNETCVIRIADRGMKTSLSVTIDQGPPR
jgi:hypothetical protein